MPKTLPSISAKTLTLDEWLAIVETPEYNRKVRVADYEFPTDQHRDEFLGSIHSRSESTIKNLLRSFLIQGGTLGTDESIRRSLRARSYVDVSKLLDEFEFLRRLTEPPFLPWDGITWILDLLPHYPAKALNVLDAYYTAHCQFLPDGRIHGLMDAEVIIRQRYLNIENSRDALLSLSSEEFEYLVGALYKKLGYKVVVTQRSRDGGVDVEATRSDPGGQAVLLVQCKRYEDVVRVAAVRELMGVVSRRHANKGVIVATCGFTSPARNEASLTPMIELIDFPALNKLLNQNFGAKWPLYMSHEIRNLQFASTRLNLQHAA
jgi:restriction system protein